MRKEVAGYEGLYEVDENGNVYSLRSSKRLKPIKMKSGYYYVHLCNGNKTKLVRIHRVVAKAFIKNPEGKEQVNHINGIKSDNRVSNLEWCDSFYNMRHAKEIGLHEVSGENNPSSKLSWDEVKKIRNEYKYKSKENNTITLARKYGVTNVMIGKIVRGECWVEDFPKERSIHREA